VARAGFKKPSGPLDGNPAAAGVREARIVAFEPVPETYAMLRENLALNDLARIEAHELAFSDKSGFVEINLFDPQFSSWNSIGKPLMTAPDGRKLTPSRTAVARVITIDEYCERQEIARIDFLKVDVEGFEAAVFRGAERMLRERRIGWICFEHSADPHAGAGDAQADAFQILKSLGYDTFAYDLTGDRFQGPTLIPTGSWADYYATKAL
jgi:FkbM family methyltransferase